MAELAAFTPEFEFDAPLEIDGNDLGGVFITVPFNVEQTWGKRGQVPVVATFDGFPYRGSVVPTGDGDHVLLVLKTIRKAIDKTWGDTVRVQLARDTAPRTVEVPADFAEGMAAAAGTRERFSKLSYSHQREYVRWIESAKKYETRLRRISEAVEMLATGKKLSNSTRK